MTQIARWRFVACLKQDVALRWKKNVAVRRRSYLSVSIPRQKRPFVLRATCYKVNDCVFNYSAICVRFFLLEFVEDGGIEGWIDDGAPQAGVKIHLDARNMMMMAIFFLQMTSQYVEHIIIFFVDFCCQNSWNSCVLFQLFKLSR